MGSLLLTFQTKCILAFPMCYSERMEAFEGLHISNDYGGKKKVTLGKKRFLAVLHPEDGG